MGGGGVRREGAVAGAGGEEEMELQAEQAIRSAQSLGRADAFKCIHELCIVLLIFNHICII